MSVRKYNLPSVSSLVAFEAVARLRGFARAADELNTSQPAISRHIRNLEIRFGAPLFVRDGQRIGLTRKGERFYADVLQSLDGLQSSVQLLSKREKEVTIACSHAVSHLLLMQRYAALRKALGKTVELRFLTAEYNLIDAAIDTGADIVFEYRTSAPDGPHVIVCDEEIKPVGTSHVIRQACENLKGNAPAPGLLALQNENYGWSDWAVWQNANPDAAHWKVAEAHDNYVYLLEAAVTGAGLALGWREFANSYIERGELVEFPGRWLATDVRIYARLTRFGRANEEAIKCLSLLEDLGRLVPDL